MHAPDYASSRSLQAFSPRFPADQALSLLAIQSPFRRNPSLASLILAPLHPPIASISRTPHTVPGTNLHHAWHQFRRAWHQFAPCLAPISPCLAPISTSPPGAWHPYEQSGRPNLVPGTQKRAYFGAWHLAQGFDCMAAKLIFLMMPGVKSFDSTPN